MSNTIYNYISQTKVINTHSHYGDKSFFKEFNLTKLLKNSYISWCGVDFDETIESRKELLQQSAL